MTAIRKKINNYLNKPFPLFLSTIEGMMYLFFAVLIFGVLINLVQPFGAHAWHAPHKWMILSGYGILYAGVYILIYWFGSFLFPAYYTPESWTIRKEFRVLALYFPLTIFLCCIFTIVTIPEMQSHKLKLFELIGYNMLLVTITTYIFGLYVKLRLGTVIAVDADNLVPELQPESESESELEPELPVCETLPVPTTMPPLLFIDFKKTRYKVDDIPFLESKGNNMIIHVLANGQIRESIILYTLKKAVVDLTPFPQMQRCHDSFIVNLDYVVAFKKKDHGLELTLQQCDFPVSVSASYREPIQEMLHASGIFRK
jgi:hypothetical protein